MSTIAFWAPDIIPPDEWLMPAVLYQDRIATIAPMASLEDPDGRKTSQMREALGDLWERVYFQPSILDLERFVHARLEWWLQLASSQARYEADLWTRKWLDRVRAWPHDRLRVLREALAQAERELAEAQRLGSLLISDSEAAQTRLEARRTRVTQELAELRPVMVAEKEQRVRALAALRAQIDMQRRGAWRIDPNADRELNRLYTEMRSAAGTLVASPSPDRQRFLALQQELKETNDEARLLRQQKVDADNARRRIHEGEQRIRRVRERITKPWVNDPPTMNLLMGGATIDEGLGTIGWGKIWGDRVFEFLATQGGMWTLSHQREPWAHSLIAPTWIVEDLLVALAELRVASQPNWALAGRISQLTDRTVGPRDPAVAIGFSLPSPMTGTVEDAIRFRRSHAEELERLRQAIQANMTVFDAVELNDAIGELRWLVAEPLAEITRALELDKKLGCKSIGLTTLREIPLGLKGLAAGALATLLAVPLVGESLTTRGLIGSAIGGAVLVGMRIGSATISASWERHRIERAVLGGPYRYLYDVGAQFGIATAH